MPEYILPTIPLDSDNNVLNRETRILRYDVEWGRPYGALDYAQIVIASNPFGFWRFDTDNNIVENLGFYGVGGTGTYFATNPTLIASAVGLCDGAADFDGTSQYMVCGNIAFAANAVEHSLGMTFWMYPKRTVAEKAGAIEVIVGKGNTTSGSFRVILDANNFLKVQVFYSAAWNTVLTSAAEIQLDKWTFVGVSYRDNDQFLIIDDAAPVTATNANLPVENLATLVWGGALNASVLINDASTKPFKGGLDEGAVYKTHLPINTVRQQFRQGLSRSYFEPLQDVETSPVQFQTIPGITYENLISGLNPVYFYRFNEAAMATDAVNLGSDSAIVSTYAGADLATSRLTPGATIDTTDNPCCRKFSGRHESNAQYFESYMTTNTALDLGTAGTRTAFSISFWFKQLVRPSNSDDVCGVYNVRKGQGFVVLQQKGRIGLFLRVGSKSYGVWSNNGAIVEDETGVGRDTWYQVTFTVSATGRMRCFINGQSNGFDKQTPDNKGMLVPDKELASAYFKIGKCRDGTPHPGFVLDDLHIHPEKELTSQEAWILYMNGRYGSTYGSRIVSSGSDGITEASYEVVCNELSQLVNETDISDLVADWVLEYDDKQFVSAATLSLHEEIDRNTIDQYLLPNTYVKIQERYWNGLDTEDTEWIDSGHFLVEGPGLVSDDADGNKNVRVVLRGLLKTLSFDIMPTIALEPDRLLVPKQPLTLVGTPVTYYKFQCPRPEDPTSYYENWVEAPSVRLWVTKLTKTSSAVGDAKEANELYRIKGAEGNLQVFGGEGSIHIDREFYESSIKDVGLGQPDTTGGVLAEFYRFCQPRDVVYNEPIVGIGYDGRYYLRVKDNSLENIGKSVFVQSGNAIGKTYKVIDERIAYQDSNGNLGNYQNGTARGVFKDWAEVARVGSTLAWEQEAEAKYKDDIGAYARKSYANGTSATHFLQGTNPALDSVIPTGATITFIKVTIRKKGNYAFNWDDINVGKLSTETVYDKEVFLVKGGTIQTGATNKADLANEWDFDAWEDKVYGGTLEDLWGVSGGYTTGDLGSGFGVALACDIQTPTSGSGGWAHSLIDYAYVEIGWELFVADNSSGSGSASSGGSGGGSGNTGLVYDSHSTNFLLSAPEQYNTAGNWFYTPQALSADPNFAVQDLRCPGGSPTVYTHNGKAMRVLRPADDLFYSIPTSAVLRGIEIKITRSGNVLRVPQSGGYAYNWIEDKQVQLVFQGTTSDDFTTNVNVVGTNKAKQGYAHSWGGASNGQLIGEAPYVPAHTTVTYGGPTDLWGLDTDPATSAFYRNPFAIFGGNGGNQYFGVQIAARAQYEASSWRPYMEAQISYVEIVVHWGVPGGTGDAGGGDASATGDYTTSGFTKLYIRGPYGHIVSPAYEGMRVGDTIKLGDDNSIESALTKVLLQNFFQMRDATKPFYFEMVPPSVPDGSTLPPYKNKLGNAKMWAEQASDILSVAPPNYMLMTYPDGITRTENLVQKAVGEEDLVIDGYMDLAEDGTDYAVYNRVVAEGEGGDSLNVATHLDYAGQAAVRCYHLKNFFNPDDRGSDEGYTHTQTVANAIIKKIFDNSIKTPGPDNPTIDTSSMNYGLVYQFSSDSVRRWTFEDTPLFCLDIGKDIATNEAFEIEAFQMVFIDTYRQDKGGRRIPQSLRVYYMTEDDYVAEFGRYPPDVPSQTDADSKPDYMSELSLNNADATYFPPSNARSWRLWIDEFNCSDGQFSIESDNFMTEEPTKFRFMKVELGQTHFAYGFGTDGSGTYDGDNAKAVARVNMADIKLWTSRRIVAVASLGQAPSVGLDTGYHKKLFSDLRRRTFYVEKNPYLDNFDKAQTFANNELLERYREFRPRAITALIPHVFLGCTVRLYDKRYDKDVSFIIRAFTKSMDGRVSAQITNFDPLPPSA